MTLAADKQVFASNLKQARKDMGWTRNRLCQELNMSSVHTLDAWEEGVNLPTLITARRLSVILQKPMDWFWEEYHD